MTKIDTNHRAKCWDGSDDDVNRAVEASHAVARRICPPEMLPYLGALPRSSAHETLYDAHIRGVDFSTASVSERRKDHDLRGDVTFRLIGAFHDRALAIRFEDVTAYDAPTADHLGIGDIYWIEFLQDGGSARDFVCRIHTLAVRRVFSLRFRRLSFQVTAPLNADMDTPTTTKWRARTEDPAPATD